MATRPRHAKVLDARGLASENGAVRQRILNVAEKLFFEKGLDVSVRELTAEADVNLAGINYYFGSKNGLVQAVLERLANRVNEKRIARLHAILDRARTSRTKPSLNEIVMAFMEPYLDKRQDGKLIARIVVQDRMQPSPLTRLILDRHFDTLAEEFVHAFGLANPGISEATRIWRYSFMTSTIVLTMANYENDDLVDRLSKGRIDTRTLKKRAKELSQFLVGALSAPE